MMMTIKEATQTLQEKDLKRLYDAVDWRHYTQHKAGLKAHIEASLVTFCAYQDDTLVGLIRVVGDGLSIVYIQDLLVDPDHQRQGIGSALLERALQTYEHVRQILLLTDDTPTARAFYEHQGLIDVHKQRCVAYIKPLKGGV